MSSFQRKTAAMAVLAVSALVFAGVGVVGAQQQPDEAARVLELEKRAQALELQRLEAQEQLEAQRTEAERQLEIQQRQFEAQMLATQQELEERQVEEQRRLAEMERALAQEMEFRMRPAFRFGNFFSSRSGALAGRILAASEDLELTEAQEQTIRDNQRQHRRDEIRRDADIEIAELELEEMMEADSPDLDAIESHMRQIANLQVDERMANLRLDRSVRELLTVEQADKLDEMSGERVRFGTIQRQRSR